MRYKKADEGKETAILTLKKSADRRFKWKSSRPAFVLCISFTIVQASGWPFAYWFPMTAFLMLMPYAEESVTRVNNRVPETLLGLAITFVLMQLYHIESTKKTERRMVGHVSFRRSFPFIRRKCPIPFIFLPPQLCMGPPRILQNRNAMGKTLRRVDCQTLHFRVQYENEKRNPKGGDPA